MSDREPVGQAVNAIIMAMSEIARMAHNPETYDEVAAEERALWTIKNQAEWLLSYLRERQDEAPHLRLVQ
jgi:hypothetical protein